MLLEDQLLRSVLAKDPDGILVCDATRDDKPVIYVNPAMEKLTGYAADEILGRSPAFLVQPADVEPAQGDPVQRALTIGDECQLRVKSVRRDGTSWACELRCAPLKDARDNVQGVVSYWREIEAVAGAGRTIDNDPLATAMLDPLTGLLRRAYFDESLRRDWDIAHRDARTLTLFLLEIDGLPEFEQRQGRLEGEQVVRRVARVVSSCFRRAQDLCGRFDYLQMAVLAARSDLGSALEYAEVVQGRVRELHIRNAQPSAAGIMTVSMGIANALPTEPNNHAKLMQAAQNCLRQARETGGNRVVGRVLDRRQAV